MTVTDRFGHTYKEGSIGYYLFKDTPPDWLFGDEVGCPYQIAIRGFLSTSLWQIEGYQRNGGTHWLNGTSCEMSGYGIPASKCRVRIRHDDGTTEEHFFSINQLLKDIQSGSWRHIAEHTSHESPVQLELF